MHRWKHFGRNKRNPYTHHTWQHPFTGGEELNLLNRHPDTDINTRVLKKKACHGFPPTRSSIDSNTSRGSPHERETARRPFTVTFDEAIQRNGNSCYLCWPRQRRLKKDEIDIDGYQ
ncbi:hypothetical protein BV898_01086 [Hypsibius exemplaris]|uniref:Uncharacterized protein n=1 Tax=Hypsibius exemplaris TaxID=2072580 RepID=A0A1W0XD56_HYPEX|nr:hypothetical protein BV898_01086 [Hypsibius exemplaris]